LETIRQGPNDSASDIIIRVQDLVSKVGLASEDIQIRYLLRSLHPDLSFEAERSKPKTWLEAVDAITQAENLLLKYRRGNQWDAPVQPRRPAMDPHPPAWSVRSQATSSMTIEDLVRQLTDLKVHHVHQPSQQERKPARHVFDIAPWMKRTGNYVRLLGLELNELGPSYCLPGVQEERLLYLICESIGRVLEKTMTVLKHDQNIEVPTQSSCSRV
jgi:hypothetical protein